MFIETPAGWKAPKTAWGDPDLQGTWPINYVGSVPLERCAGGRRPRRRTASAMRSEQGLLHRRGIQGARRRRQRTRQPLRRRDEEGRLRRGLQRRQHRPDDTAATDFIDRRPAERQAAGDDRRGQASVVADAQQLGSVPGRSADVRFPVRLRYLGSLHHARHARLDVPLPLQQRRADHPGARLRDSQHGDDPRGAHHPARQPAAGVAEDQAVARRVARPLGRHHARHRDDELQGGRVDDEHRRRGIAAGQPLPHQREDEDHRAPDAAERSR